MVNKTRPSAYQPPLPFHIVRIATLVSALIVGGILAYFIAQLRSDGFRLPWTFLVMFLADILLLLSLLISSLLYCCVHLSPLLNMIVNIPILCLWTIGWGLLIWNMYGTLGHSCSINNWGNSDGVMICHQYKALFSFVVIGWLCQVALLVLDVRAKRNQNALGRYNKMADNNADFKMDPLHSRESSVHDIPYGVGLDAARDRQLQQQHDPHAAPQPSMLNRAMSTASSFYSSVAPAQTQNRVYEAYRPNAQPDAVYSRGNNDPYSMNDFNRSNPSQQMHYDNHYGR